MVTENTHEYRALLHEILGIHKTIISVAEAKLEGDVDKAERLIRDCLEGFGSMELKSERPAPETESPHSQSIAEALETYVSEKERAETMTLRSEQDMIYSLLLFIELAGISNVSEINHKTMNRYFERLLNFPSNKTKKAKYRDLSTETIINTVIPKIDRISVATINKHLMWIKQFLSYAERRGLTDKDYGTGLRMPTRSAKRAYEITDAFGKKELEMIFRSRCYFDDSFLSPYMFWVPILGLYTGMRLAEICQLELKDIQNINGIECFVVQTNEKGVDAKKRLKTKAAQRIVPIHSFLLDDLNLMGYIQKLKDKRQTRLFPELPYMNHNYGHIASKWFQNYKKRIGLESSSKRFVFHSFRHTMIDHLKQAGADMQVVVELVGHASGSITAERYGKRYKPEILKRVIEMLNYEVRMQHLCLSKWVVR